MPVYQVSHEFSEDDLLSLGKILHERVDFQWGEIVSLNIE
jgi:hypothetical protein